MLHAAISQPDTISRGVITKLKPFRETMHWADANRVPDRVVLKEQWFSLTSCVNGSRDVVAKRRRMQNFLQCPVFAMNGLSGIGDTLIMVLCLAIGSLTSALS